MNPSAQPHIKKKEMIDTTTIIPKNRYKFTLSSRE